MPSQLELYDQSTANSVDPYLSVKSIYLQNRKLLEAQ
jgi:ABC-type transporter lipoprotein component MlaA